MASNDDWRLRGQEDYLQRATIVRKRYYAHSAEWEQDHCEFCWAKFMDPSFSPDHAQFTQDHPQVLVEGYGSSGWKDDPWNSGRLLVDLPSVRYRLRRQV